MLEIRIHQDHRIALSLGKIQAGQHRRFFTKVAGEADQGDLTGRRRSPLVIRAHQVANDAGAGVLRAVVNENQPLDSRLASNGGNERSNAGRFVKARRNHPDPWPSKGGLDR